MVIKVTYLSKYNPWWKEEEWEKSDKDLKHVDLLLPRRVVKIKKSTIYLFRGIRRSGKSVFLKQLIKNLIRSGIEPRRILYISCDRYSEREILNIIREFRLRFGEGVFVFLDEITYLENWQRLLKVLSEEDATVVATGSNPVEIKKKAERLPGRGIEGNEYLITPFSFREFLKFNGKNYRPFPPERPEVKELIYDFDEIEELFFKYLISGGFPRAVTSIIKSNRVEEDFFEEIIRVILGDISKCGKSESIARDILTYILDTKGSRTDYHAIAKELGISHVTVREYLELLEDCGVLFVLEAWDISKKLHARRKQKKIVFQSSAIPLALARYIFGYEFDELLEFLDKNIEWIIEHVVISHIIWSKIEPITREKRSFAGFFYSDKECDIVLLEKGKFFGVEVKYGKLRKLRYPFEVIYLTKDEVGENIYPVSLYLAGLEKSKKVI